MKSVLLHVQDDEGLEARLQAAMAIVRASGGHLSCLQITPVSAYVAFDGFGGALAMGDIMKALDEREDALRAEMEARLSLEDISWDYAQVAANPGGLLIARAALNDLLVLSRHHHHASSAYPAMTMFGDILHASRTPMLVQPGTQTGFDPLGPVIVAWNGSFEAANAIRQALPLIAMASAVHVVTVEEERDDRFPSTAASEYLARHGIMSEIHSHDGGGRPVAQTIIDAASIHRASAIVMGAYGHSRAHEYLFGGVTRALLKDCPVPLVLGR